MTRLGRIVLLLTFGMTISMDLVSRTGSVIARFDWLFQNIPYVTSAVTLILVAFIAYEMLIQKKSEIV